MHIVVKMVPRKTIHIEKHRNSRLRMQGSAVSMRSKSNRASPMIGVRAPVFAAVEWFRASVHTTGGNGPVSQQPHPRITHDVPILIASETASMGTSTVLPKSTDHPLSKMFAGPTAH
jgi:hypothetical protein